MRDDLIDLDRRTTTVAAFVNTAQTTAVQTYTDLATPGPAVTLPTGALVQVAWSSQFSNNQTGYKAIMSFAVSGATTLAASDNYSLYAVSSLATEAMGASMVYAPTVSAGTNTFTCKYRVDGNTGLWGGRTILVTPLTSA